MFPSHRSCTYCTTCPNPYISYVPLVFSSTSWCEAVEPSFSSESFTTISLLNRYQTTVAGGGVQRSRFFCVYCSYSYPSFVVLPKINALPYVQQSVIFFSFGGACTVLCWSRSGSKISHRPATYDTQLFHKNRSCLKAVSGFCVRVCLSLPLSSSSHIKIQTAVLCVSVCQNKGQQQQQQNTTTTNLPHDPTNQAPKKQKEEER